MTPKYSERQVRAIKAAIITARQLQRTNPEMANLYRQGKTYSEISRDFGLHKKYGVRERTASSIVSIAIRGHKGCYGIPALEGMIPGEELRLIAAEHKKVSASKNGTDTLDRKVGVHGISKKDRIKLGLKTYGSGKGIAAMTREERVRVGRISGRKIAIANGYTPWKDAESDREISELDFLEAISYYPSFIYSEGINRGKRNLGAIAQEINRSYHDGNNVRSKSAINNALKRVDQMRKREALTKIVECLEGIVRRSH